MTAPYRDTSAHALRLHLYPEPVDWSGPTVFLSGRASVDGLRVKASVIGSSHVMEVRAQDFSLTELLACQAPANGHAAAFWKPGDPQVEYVGGGEVRYCFDARMVAWPRARGELAILRGLIERSVEVRSELGLSCQFPVVRDGHHAAETLVWAAVTGQRVVARTAHSYPSESLVVLSTTAVHLTRSNPVDSEIAVCVAG